MEIIEDTYTPLLYEPAFTVTRSVSGLVAGWVTQGGAGGLRLLMEVTIRYFYTTKNKDSMPNKQADRINRSFFF